ncbi:glycoprotein with ribonuclease inhibitor domain (yddK) (modular protein) [Shigella sonnei]|nr:glycoprotein with ribonuclease inhibitor domain (yddK) (modular protein) [Shigella sonnei]SRZ94572.1 glycoprotein with ribonuclease inhibitor domain (yddK) (modular protein) [Shigella sonnei]
MGWQKCSGIKRSYLEQDGYMVGDHRCAILMLLDKAGNQLWDVPVHRMKM